MAIAESPALTTLAATGSTGNNTHTGVEVRYEGEAGYPMVGFQFIVEAVGATPTITFKYQASLDGSTWNDVSYYDANSATVTAANEAKATQTVTGVGTTTNFLGSPGYRFWRYFRCVTTANTNVTYRAELYQLKV